MEEEKVTTKEMLEKKIQECIDGLNYVEQGDKKHCLLVNDIKNLTSAYMEMERMEFQKFDSERKFLEETRQKNLDRDYRDILERDKLQIQVSTETAKMANDNEQKRLDRENEAEMKNLDREYHESLEKLKMETDERIEEKKINEIRKTGRNDMLIKIAGIVIPASLYFVFLGLGMRLEFIDNGSITSYTVKELLKSLHPKI